MKSQRLRAIVILVTSLTAVVGMARAAQDRFTLKALNGVAFSEFRGYDTWQTLAPSQTDDGLKVILGNAVTVNAFKAGVPAEGKAFPDGSMIAKIEWSKEKNTASPYSVTVPGTLKSVALMKKDSKRFPDTGGWGYAQFLYDATSDTFKPFGTDASFGKVCYQCHTRVTARNFVFTSYARK